jgi:hypothetical protein
VDVRTYRVTPQQLAELAAKMQANGINFDPKVQNGEATAHGFRVLWNIGLDRIVVSMLEHPPFMAGAFWHELEAKLGKAIA